MKKKTIAAALATAALATMSLPMSAPAQIHQARRGGISDESPNKVVQQIYMRGSHRYGFEISLEDRRKLEIQVSKFNRKTGSSSEVSYKLNAPQDRSTDGIDAKIGKVGRIDLHFVPQTTKERKPHCEGDTWTIESGYYVGSISFHGEGGFTDASAKRVPGTVEHGTPKSCRSPRTVKDPASEGTEAEASSASGTKVIRSRPEIDQQFLLAAAPDEGKTAFKFVRTEETVKGKPSTYSEFIVFGKRVRDGVKEDAALALGEHGHAGFEFPDAEDPTSAAIIDPSSPLFSGSATFHKEPGGENGWIGDLKVELPGMGTVPLVAPGAKAFLRG
jgi:hypothetical protein